MSRIVAVGDNDGDACLLQEADLGIAFEPKTCEVAKIAKHVIRGNIALPSWHRIQCSRSAVAKATLLVQTAERRGLTRRRPVKVKSWSSRKQ